MSTRRSPPTRCGSTTAWSAWVLATLGSAACQAAPSDPGLAKVESAVIASSGPWLLAAVVLVLAVVAGLACALGYLLGRRAAQLRTAESASESPEQNATVNVEPASTGATLGESDHRGLPSTQGAAEHSLAAPTADEGLSFSYTVSHDLRAPVRVVDGFARILKEDYSKQLDRIGNDHLDRILSAAARMNAMIDAMLSLAQLSSQPLARQPVNLSQVAGYIVEDLRRAHPQRSVAVEIEPDLRVTGDPTLMRLVLENLLSNAWKYTGRTETAVIQLSAQWQDGQRVFEVRDNGAGFDMRSSERLFGLFQRLHSANDFPGTGVGLASVQRIIRRHGGDIWAESSPGQGARFRFTIKS